MRSRGLTGWPHSEGVPADELATSEQAAGCESVRGFGFWVLGFGSDFCGFGLMVFDCMVFGFWLLISHFSFLVYVLGFRFWDFEFRLLALGFRVQGLGSTKGMSTSPFSRRKGWSSAWSRVKA